MNNKDLVIMSVLTAFLSSIIVFICLDVSNGNFDNLADWFGALGSIGAILAVIYQVHKQREEFLDANQKGGEVCLKAYRDMSGYKLKHWIVNTGKSVEGYRFIGFVAEKDIEALLNGSKGAEVAVQFFGNVPYYDVESNLESLVPAGQSEKIELDITMLKSFFDRKTVYIVYKGLSGDFYTKKVTVKY